MSKGSDRRPLGRGKTQDEFDESWDKAFRSAEEIHAEQIAIQVTDGRENGLMDEEIEALLEERFGVYISLEDYDNADT